MQSLESLGHNLEVSRETLESSMPGAFVRYDPIKHKSSDITLASASGAIMKRKKRTPEKAIYEFLALDVWNKLLDKYSDPSGLQFRAPKPIGLFSLDSDNPAILMEFLNGFELRKLCAFKRSTPVQIRGQKTPVPLYPACALHLGALNRLKEFEELYHSDFDGRHIIFSPVENVSISVVDLENSRKSTLELVSKESKKGRHAFERITSSPRDLEALQAWYQQGEESLRLPDSPRLNEVVEQVSRKYDVDLDFGNMVINGYHLRLSRSHAL